MNQTDQLHSWRHRHGVLVAAHRGVAAGNIPCNTIAAFEAALRQGAHIIEFDVTLSADGVPFVFHPKQEKNHLNRDIHLEQMTSEEISRERFVNVDNTATFCPIVTLEEALKTLKGRCLINLDHAWDDLPQVIEIIRRLDMVDQILMKTPMKEKYLKQMEELAPDMMFMPIIKEQDTVTEMLEQMNIRYVAAELVFKEDTSYLASQEYIASHHEKGRLVWANAILYDSKVDLSGGHTDDVAVTRDPYEGWGWLVDRGFDMIQTDWVAPLSQYLNMTYGSKKEEQV